MFVTTWRHFCHKLHTFDTTCDKSVSLEWAQVQSEVLVGVIRGVEGEVDGAGVVISLIID